VAPVPVFLPLIVCGVLLVAVSSQLGDAPSRLGHVAGAVSGVKHAVQPLVQDARRALTRALGADRSR
jgi:hypothetical protein